MNPMISPQTADVAGYFGVAFYLASYAGLQFGVIRGTGYLYAALNLVAAGLVLVGLSYQFNLPSAIIQGTWIVISVIGMARLFILTHSIRLSPEEQALHDGKMPDLSKIAARRFFDAGLWLQAEAGTVLLREGETHGVLIYIASGEAEVFAADRQVGVVRAGNFLGEMTVLQDSPATATVVLAEDARYFRITGERLKRLGARDAEFRVHMENALSRDTRLKLIAVNARLGDAHSRGQSRDAGA